jgi:methylmalonyl-CoA mutase cobalamin-binding domain/chain
MAQRKYTNRRYLDALEKKVLVFDGAMGTSLQLQDLTAEHFGGEQYNGCNDYLVISYPEAVEKVHRSFLEAGVDVLETDTFRSNRLTMVEYKLQDRIIEINVAAASLARRLADEYGEKTGQPRFVAGSIGPSGKLPSTNDPELSNVKYDELIDTFREQAVGLIQGGVDLLLIETSQDILEVKAAITGIHQAFSETNVYLPIQAQVTLDTTGRMLLGTDINASLTILEGMGIDVIGLNCSTGPEHMREPIRFLGENSTLPVSCIPNAGLPLNVDGQAVYPLEPEPYANDMYEFVTKHNVRVVGGCCGTTPAHLKLLVDKLSDYQLPSDKTPLRSTPQLASAMSAIAMRQDPAPTLLGERCNAQGSRKFKRLLLEEDYDGILDIAREQVAGGAHALDISVAVTERADEAEQMRKVVKKLQMGVDVPLVIDTTELDVLEVALQTAPGRCLINSTHLESGRDKADKIFALAKKYNAAVIVLTIDENGMAKTAQRKYEVAQRIYDIAVNDHGLKPEDLVFDDLTFTLATGDVEFVDSAKETIEGIRLIKQKLPGVMTSLGVSNLSFGFAPQARPPLNSVMLYYCVQAGLDMAIVNAAHVMPYAEIGAEERELCEDLIFNRREDALQRFIQHFENVEVSTESNVSDPTEGMTSEQRLHWKILHRVKEGVEADIDEIINRTLTPNPSPVGEGDLPPSPLGGRAGDEGEKLIIRNPRLPEELKERIRKLRKESTEAEQLLWKILRNRGFHDAKFRRQHPKEGFILDFYCHEAKLCVELDGSQHNEDEQVKYDENRTKILNEKKGIQVIRFWNSDILNKTEEVLNVLWNILDERLAPSPLTPLPLERETHPLPPTGEGLGMRASRHEVAVGILNNVLLPAMKEVGDKFGAGELILPFVLQSAETMKKTVSHLENYLEKVEGITKGTVVIATVYGDVHDIGKNLVKTILANNGYTVIDLGKQVPAETIITESVKANATAIGLSALLVSTSKQMPLIVNEMQRRGHKIPILVGGAAINRRFGRRILFTEGGEAYEPGVFYCKDAFEGLDTMDALIDPNRKPAMLEKLRKDADMEMNRASQTPDHRKTEGTRSNIVPAPIAVPAKLGQRIVKDMPLEMVLKHLNMNELYRLSWGAKNSHGKEWEKLKAEFDARLAKMTKDALKEGWIKPQAVYGYFACQADGDSLIIYENAENKKEIERFHFPRQPYDDHLALSDYYASVESGQMDVVALQVVTVGLEATEKFEKLQAANDYTEAYFIHGLAVQTAEATANYLHEHIRRELGLAEEQGKRYSWGYPAIPELEDHFKVFKLLPAVESELGMSLATSGQLIPEQSTAAIIVHHKDAKYYSVGESRVEQLMK